MKIYKQAELHRLASEMLCKELIDNKGYTFTNTSYGTSGTVFGTIEKKEAHVESVIQYLLLKDWHDGSANLVRQYSVRSWKDPSKNVDEGRPVLVLYTLNSNADVFCDGEDYAKQAHEKNSVRYDAHKTDTPLSSNTYKKWFFVPHTKQYDKYFAEISSEKPIKYGTEIYYYLHSYTDTRYDHNDYSKKIKTVELRHGVHYVYRGRDYQNTRKPISYDLISHNL